MTLNTNVVVDWPQVLSTLVQGETIGVDSASSVMRLFLSGDVDPELIAAFLVALEAKRTNAEELGAMLRVVREASVPVVLGDDLQSRAVDIVGTGGDRSNSVNVSTMAALVVAAAGVPVCKHGNRAASSKCGSADLLEGIGISINALPEQVAESVKRHNFGFCFAPNFHPALKHVGPVRRQIGIRTVFNVLGPLANPAGVKRFLLGVSDPLMLAMIPDALVETGSTDAWVVHGDGLDELTLCGPSDVHTISNGVSHPVSQVLPSDAGLNDCRELGAIVGGDVGTNVAAARAMFSGARGAVRDIVIYNAAAALVVARRSSSLVDGAHLAAKTVDCGAVTKLVSALTED